MAGTNREWAEKALAQIEAQTATVQVGKIYDGRVTSIKDFGAFVEILPGRDGLCHISELADSFVKSVSDVVQIGDVVKVKVINIDEQGRVKLSRKAVLKEELADGAAGKDEELVRQAQALLDLLKAHGAAPSATLAGSGRPAPRPRVCPAPIAIASAYSIAGSRTSSSGTAQEAGPVPSRSISRSG